MRTRTAAVISLASCALLAACDEKSDAAASREAGAKVLPTADAAQRAANTPALTNVVVVNPNAIPVTAAQSGSWSVSLSGTPTVTAAQGGEWSVAASQGGPWTVGLAAGSGVVVNNPANAPLPTKDVENPARSFVKLNKEISISQGYGVGPIPLQQNGSDYQVPAGKILVVEFASIRCTVPAGNQVSANLAGHFLPLQYQSSPGPDVFVGAQQTRIYVPAQSSVYAGYDTSSLSNFADCISLAEGHLVNDT